MSKHIYAPWRAEYILGPKEKECIFCRMAGEDKDRENFIVHRAEHCFVVMNRYPYTTGHLMIVPYRHQSDLEALSVAEMGELMALAQKVIAGQKRESSPQGFNVGFNLGRPAGAGIEEHLHLHVVPRWEGDSSFVAVIDDTRVLSLPLGDVYESLKRCFE
ncbi:MAG: HIT domain-containing protein [bacterium]